MKRLPGLVINMLGKIVSLIEDPDVAIKNVFVDKKKSVDNSKKKNKNLNDRDYTVGRGGNLEVWALARGMNPNKAF